MTPTDHRLARPRHLVGAAAIVIALLVLIVLPAATRAEDILRLNGPVTDTTGVLAAGEDEIVAAIENTRDSHGVEVFVLFIRTTGDRTASDYANETAARNSLGGDDALLLVAIDDRTDQIWVADGLDEITDDELDDIITGILEPGLRDGDFAAAVIGSVEAIGLAASSAPITAPPATTPPATDPPGGGGSTGGDGGIGLGAIVGVGLIAGGAFFLWRRRGRGTKPAAGDVGAAPSAPAPDATALAREANALLIATDERIRDAAQETDFAEAQFGPEAVTTFRAAVAEARDELAKAFAIRQRLDDATPEDEATTIALLQEIIDGTSKAQDRLDAETERIRELRDLERDAPNTLVELPARIEAVEDRLDATSETMAGLRAYAETVWAPVQGNLEEARKGLAGARTAVTIGSVAAASDDASDVALATRTALEGMTGAGLLLDEIDQLAASVADAGQRIPGELAAAERDLGDATSTVAGRPEAAGADTRRRGAATALQAAVAAASAAPADPIETLRLATEARRLADEALLSAKDWAAAADRVLAAADSTIRTASAEVDRAATFIASRRRGVGEVARTRLAEADRHLTVARSQLSSDPNQALEEGRRAQALAQEAYRLAQDDFTDWDQGGPGWGQRAGTPQGDQTAAVLGQILGGIVGGVLAGSGRSGGGWGGSPWGGSGSSGGGGLGGGWGGGGGFGSGGFGGGGGGGRSRGGRW